MNITNTILVRSLLSEETDVTARSVQECYAALASRLGRKSARLSWDRTYRVEQRVNEIRHKHSPKSISTVAEILRGQTDRRGPKPAGHHNETENQMKDKKEIKVTLRFHPNKALGQKYEVVKFVNAIIVEYEDPANHNHKLPVRVGDYIDEAHATALNDVAEVTVLPE